MKFDGFDLDLAKIPKGFGIDPQDAGCADQEGGSTGTGSYGCSDPFTENVNDTCFTRFKTCLSVNSCSPRCKN